MYGIVVLLYYIFINYNFDVMHAAWLISILIIIDIKFYKHTLQNFLSLILLLMNLTESVWCAIRSRFLWVTFEYQWWRKQIVVGQADFLRPTKYNLHPVMHACRNAPVSNIERNWYKHKKGLIIISDYNIVYLIMNRFYMFKKAQMPHLRQSWLSSASSWPCAADKDCFSSVLLRLSVIFRILSQRCNPNNTLNSDIHVIAPSIQLGL